MTEQNPPRTPTLTFNISVSSPLSPITSPAPQVKQHTAGNLTGDLRKVKDLAADIHNLISKWNSQNRLGMEIVTQIANIKIEKVFNQQESDESSTVTSLPSELGPLCEKLLGVVEDMNKLMEKMQGKAELASNLVSLQRFQHKKVENPVLFNTMTLEDVSSVVAEIYKDYRAELHLKKELCKFVAHAENRNTMLFYTTCWLHQPYIHIHTQDLLNGLLKETGHIK